MLNTSKPYKFTFLHCIYFPAKFHAGNAIEKKRKYVIYDNSELFIIFFIEDEPRGTAVSVIIIIIIIYKYNERYAI